MPKLEKEDAKQLLIHHVALDFRCKIEDDTKNVEFCIY